MIFRDTFYFVQNMLINTKIDINIISIKKLEKYVQVALINIAWLADKIDK